MLSIIIITRNRSHFLRRQLQYYAAANFKYPILVGDSSTQEERERNQECLYGLSKKLNISYFYFPHDPQYGRGVEPFYIWYSLLQKVGTPYSVINADDDFLNAGCLDLCVEFLERNPDYSAAHGVCIALILEEAERAFRIKGANEYPQPSNEDGSSSGRLLRGFTICSSTESIVKRTSQVREMIERNLEGKFSGCEFMELFNMGFTAIQGKIKRLGSLYMVRLIHEQMASSLNRSLFKWLIHTEFANDWKAFSAALADVLAKRDGISIGDARELVKKTFWAYLGLELKRKWQSAYGQDSFKDHLRRWAREKFLLREIKGQMNSFLPRGKFTLPALLRKNSPYHKDFMPIYQAIHETKETTA